jgi:glucosamine 6-phosphate synthetase-like amidotransferase/phosphosugar isomerase protein
VPDGFGKCDIQSTIGFGEREIAALAERLGGSEHAYFVGRSAGYAVAMEGALKLKEVSYLQAEAYSPAELKHGPLALISPETPTVAVGSARRPLRQECLDDRGNPRAARTGL